MELGAELAGPGVFEHPPLTRLLGRLAKRGKRHSELRRASKIMTKLLQPSFGSGKKSGYQSPEATNGQILPFQHFYKSTHNSRTRKATAPKKSAFDIPNNAFLRSGPQI